MFPNQDAVNRHITWTDPIMKFIDVSSVSRRIVGVAADIDDENVVPGPALSVYHPFEQEIGGGRLFVHARTDPYALVTPITRIIRNLSADQPVERAATLEDVKAEVLAPIGSTHSCSAASQRLRWRWQLSVLRVCWRSR